MGSLHDIILSYGGSIPDVTRLKVCKSTYTQDYIRILNFLVYMCDNNQLKQETLSYLTLNGVDISDIQKLENWYFSSVGKIAWILNHGGEISQKTSEYFELSIKNMMSKIHIKKDEVLPISDSLFVKRQKIKDILNDYVFTNNIHNIDVLLDGFKADKVAVKIGIEYLENLKNEIEQIGVDEQCTEAYSFLTKNEINDISQRINCCLSIFQPENNKSNIQQKIKKPKKVSISKIVSRLKYLQKDEENKLRSVSPTLIFGSMCVVLFNIKKHKVSIIYANNKEGLSISGSNIINIDDKKSYSKNIKKVDEVFNNIDTSNIRRIEKLLSYIKAKKIDPIVRITTDTLVLRCYKELD